MTFAKSNYNAPKEIMELGEGWYSFSEVPQEDSYIKISALCCGTDRKALNQAKKINTGYDYVIIKER